MAAAGKDQIKTMDRLADQCVGLKNELSITLALQAVIKNNQLQAVKFITQKYDVPIENILSSEEIHTKSLILIIKTIY